MKYGIEFATVELAGTQANELVGIPQGAVFECMNGHPMQAAVHYLAERLSIHQSCFRLDVEHDPLLISHKWSKGVTTITVFKDEQPSLQFIVRYVSENSAHYFPHSLPGNYFLDDWMVGGFNSDAVASQYGEQHKVQAYLIKSGSDAIHAASPEGLPESLANLLVKETGSQLSFMSHLINSGIEIFSMIKCKDGTPQIEIPVTLDEDNPWHKGDGTFLLNFTFSDQTPAFGPPLKIETKGQEVSDAN